MKNARLTGFLAICTMVWSLPGEAAKVRYEFDGWQGPELRVYATRPAGLAPDRPVVIVMHGAQRNADDYRDQWHDLALEYDFLLIVPEFPRSDFPGSESYNLGRVFDDQGNLRPRALWSYSALEPLFDDAKRRFGADAKEYALYGHSAGSQFVHRFLFHVPGARVSRVVPANAGWYMMPDYGVDAPYGLHGSPVTRESLEAVMALPVTILLGDRDTVTDHSSLRRSPEAMLQGPHRMARGENFFSTARDWSREAGIPFNWRLEFVPGADHNNVLMAPHAVKFLLQDR
jgi:dienelactone hydrolase